MQTGESRLRRSLHVIAQKRLTEKGQRIKVVPREIRPYCEMQ